jgi:hypothetical protein
MVEILYHTAPQKVKRKVAQKYTKFNLPFCAKYHLAFPGKCGIIHTERKKKGEHKNVN